MSEACDICGHEKAMGRCWRLTCPENGAPHGLLDLVRSDMRAYGIGIVKDGQRVDPNDFFAEPPPQEASIGEKVAHVRRAPNNDGKHHCHWPGCNAQVKPAVWGCKKHWYMLPADLRQRIWKDYRPGQEQTKTPSRDYVETAHAVQAWIAEHHPPERKLL